MDELREKRIIRHFFLGMIGLHAYSRKLSVSYVIWTRKAMND
jgi:hypothetical protein